MTDSSNDDRRGALKAIVVGGSAVFGGVIATPALTVALAPALSTTQGSDKWVRVARLGDLKDGQPRRTPVISEVTDGFTKYAHENLGAVWLMRNRDEVRALSVTCPHLGCGIEKLETGFGCPCHTSAFDETGKHTAGPSPRDMDPVDTRVVGDGADRVIEVRFKKYRQGVPEREEIG
ncbi:MAG TPA: Rieske 2Fe-2S domain-containing protein [Polyangiaceae bacterium]|jgi:cytochrome b6-f complex iron-sulfur subunit/menaquinol-cytochrome c reductase iron-sulfur subunit